jgi:hypothetical protein
MANYRSGCACCGADARSRSTGEPAVQAYCHCTIRGRKPG